jgi:hypothetical protein
MEATRRQSADYDRAETSVSCSQGRAGAQASRPCGDLRIRRAPRLRDRLPARSGLRRSTTAHARCSRAAGHQALHPELAEYPASDDIYVPAAGTRHRCQHFDWPGRAGAQNSAPRRLFDPLASFSTVGLSSVASARSILTPSALAHGDLVAAVKLIICTGAIGEEAVDALFGFSSLESALTEFVVVDEKDAAGP